MVIQFPKFLPHTEYLWEHYLHEKEYLSIICNRSLNDYASDYQNVEFEYLILFSPSTRQTRSDDVLFASPAERDTIRADPDNAVQ